MIVRRVSYFTFIVAITTIATVSSCNRVKEKARETAHYAGTVAGKASSEFVDGAADGITQTFDCTLELTKALEEKGLKTGKFKITTDASGNQNVVSVYLIFNKDYKGQVSVKIFDSKNAEYGRAAANLEVKAGKAQYVDFTFDQRTDIERKSRILLE